MFNFINLHNHYTIITITRRKIVIKKIINAQLIKNFNFKIISIE